MLENWLSPANPAQFSDFKQLANHQLGKSIQIYTDYLAQPENIKLTLLGLDKKAADLVRKYLYQLQFPFSIMTIADLGNARRNDATFLIPAYRELIVEGMTPIIFGGPMSSVLAQYQSYQGRQQLINLAYVDEKLPLANKQRRRAPYLETIMKNVSPRLFNFSLIGYQGHFVPERHIRHLENSNYEHLRLGRIRKDLTEVEPLVRDADLMAFNMSALRWSDAPAQKNPSPSGLFIEEACQIVRYAGLSDKLSSIGFYDFDPELPGAEQTAQVIAQMIWYFIEGYYNRKSDFPASTNDLVEYIVDIKHIDHQVTFWKSNKSGRWWMQVPVKTNRKKHQRHQLVPCTYQDYLQSGGGDLPDRLLQAYKRFM